MFDQGFLELGILWSVSWFLAPFLLLGLGIPYAILRARDSRDQPDSQLGLKTGLHYFFSVGILQFLIGLTIVSVDLITREDRPGRRADDKGEMRAPVPQGSDVRRRDNEAIRIGFAIAAVGAACASLHFLLLAYTDDRRKPIVRRTFTGWRFAIHGLVVLFSLTGGLVMIVRKDAKIEEVKPFFAILLIWLPSWVIHVILLWHYTLGYRPERIRSISGDN